MGILTSYNLFLGQNGGSGIMSECPAGTKCVQEYFCDENAIMVNYRVSLTPAQKQQRGQLPVSDNWLSEIALHAIIFYFNNWMTLMGIWYDKRYDRISVRI